MEEKKLSNGADYLFSPKHHGSPWKDVSVWDVDKATEYSLMNNSLIRSYYKKGSGPSFNLLSRNLSPISIGHSVRSKQLYIGKFVCDQSKWHGYPGDHVYNPQDKPTPDILKKMVTDGLISYKSMSRILQGKKL